ncbi:MAG: hypothetical protein HDR32_11955 [Treponema sp.]|nr:hypothetical protein [Treponema sp.]
MKMTKKVLLTAAVMAAAAFGFMGCAADDDENDMIEKVNSNNYSINYTNNDKLTSRGYISTNLAHNGAVMEFKFTNSTANSAAGVLGFIWEFEDKDGVRQFYVLGVRQDNGIPSYYVSQFKNVTDINAENFGTKLEKNPATETLIAPATNKGGNATSKDFNKITDGSWDESGTVTVYADIAPVKGGYEIRFYKSELTAKNHSVADAVGEKISITSDFATATTEPSQKKLAIYANVYGNKTLTGSWKFVSTYKDAEVAEPDAE